MSRLEFQPCLGRWTLARSGDAIKDRTRESFSYHVYTAYTQTVFTERLWNLLFCGLGSQARVWENGETAKLNRWHIHLLFPGIEKINTREIQLPKINQIFKYVYAPKLVRTRYFNKPTTNCSTTTSMSGLYSRLNVTVTSNSCPLLMIRFSASYSSVLWALRFCSMWKSTSSDFNWEAENKHVQNIERFSNGFFTKVGMPVQLCGMRCRLTTRNTMLFPFIKYHNCYLSTIKLITFLTIFSLDRGGGGGGGWEAGDAELSAHASALTSKR